MAEDKHEIGTPNDAESTSADAEVLDEDTTEPAGAELTADAESAEPTAEVAEEAAPDAEPAAEAESAEPAAEVHEEAALQAEAAASEPEPEAELASEEPAPEAAVEKAAPDEPSTPSVPGSPKAKRKRLPRPLRPQRTKAKREKPKERRPIVRLPKPEYVRGRRQERQGTVVSAATDKTIVVRVDTVKVHPRYKKVIRRSTRLHAHDETNRAKVGDIVLIVETRPVSKLKRWRRQQIVEAAK